MTTPKMDWDLETKNHKLESMITVYEAVSYTHLTLPTNREV